VKYRVDVMRLESFEVEADSLTKAAAIAQQHCDSQRLFPGEQAQMADPAICQRVKLLGISPALPPALPRAA